MATPMDADAEAASRRRAREGDEDEDRRQRSRREDKELAGSSAAFGEATANQPAGGDASDSEEERMELLAMARKAAKESSATAEPEERERAKGDLEQPTRVLYAVARGKGAFTKDDMMKEISSQLPNDCLMSYLYRGEDAAKTVFVLQPLASDVAAILAYDWRLIEVLTHDQIMTRGSFLSGFADISILRVPSSAFPREQDATGNKHGVKFTSELFMDEAAKVVVRSVIQGAKNRVIKEQSQEDGVLASLGPEIAAAWRDANSEEFTIENVEKERYFCRGKVSKVTENVLIAFKLGGGLAGKRLIMTAKVVSFSKYLVQETATPAVVAPEASAATAATPAAAPLVRYVEAKGGGEDGTFDLFTDQNQICIAYTPFCPYHATTLHAPAGCMAWQKKLKQRLNKKQGASSSLEARQTRREERNDKAFDSRERERSFGA